LLVAAAVLALLATGCGGTTSSGRAKTTTTNKTDALSGSVHVVAAASLTEAFTAMGKAFEAAHAATKVTFSFAASSALAEQINQGAPADVFASADEANMKKVTDTANAAHPEVFARNRLAILVENGNPKGVTSLGDLARPGITVVLCAPEVPCGRYAAAALAKADVAVKPASLEENVKAVVSKVTLGEADAGIVYVTDVKSAGAKAQGVAIDIAGDPSLEAVYPIAVTKAATNLEAARAWVRFVLSGAGQATLRRFGFLSP
jgi:molybdate transport system substrate-binding protein